MRTNELISFFDDTFVLAFRIREEEKSLTSSSDVVVTSELPRPLDILEVEDDDDETSSSSAMSADNPDAVNEQRLKDGSGKESSASPKDNSQVRKRISALKTSLG